MTDPFHLFVVTLAFWIVAVGSFLYVTGAVS